MVGDRIDNDIVPARLLGMRTIRFKCGRHAAQEPRSWTELPDATVTTPDELAAAIDRIAAQ
jgi:FMN phosphatase YigB (HAD superfamily)